MPSNGILKLCGERSYVLCKWIFFICPLFIFYSIYDKVSIYKTICPTYFLNDTSKRDIIVQRKPNHSAKIQLDVQLNTASRCEFRPNGRKQQRFKTLSFRPRTTWNLMLSCCQKNVFFMQMTCEELMRTLPKAKDQIQFLKVLGLGFFCWSNFSEKNIPGNSAVFAVIHRGTVISF